MAQATSPKSSRTPQRRAGSSTNSIAQDEAYSDPPPVESPSISTPSARARFEFEHERGNDGTKILMVEWEDDSATRKIHGKWTVSWEGKSHIVPAEERSKEDESGTEHRLFFLLPPGVNVPAIVTLTLEPDHDGRKVVWKTNPLPAIFPPGLADTAVDGQPTRSKGVLHTLWAKKRLQTLSREIEREAELNVEGVALEMAVREQRWIESTFGVTSSNPTTTTADARRALAADPPRSPTTPMSPGGRLSEKLRGLKLQTAEAELRRRGGGGGAEARPLSPDAADIAVAPYSAFRESAKALRAVPAQRPPRQPPLPRAAVRAPQQDSSGSLDGVISGGEDSSGADDDGDESGLFALPLSPRSPDMTKSPFSFAKKDTLRYVEGSRGEVA